MSSVGVIMSKPKPCKAFVKLISSLGVFCYRKISFPLCLYKCESLSLSETLGVLGVFCWVSFVGLEGEKA